MRNEIKEEKTLKNTSQGVQLHAMLREKFPENRIY